MSQPSHSEADRALSPRHIGARVAAGPFQALPRGRWGVPAVAYLSLWPLGDIVLAPERGRWRAERETAGNSAAAETMRYG